MVHYVSLGACLGALAFGAALAADGTEPGDPVAVALAAEDCESGVLGDDEVGARCFAAPHELSSPLFRVRVVPSGPECVFVVDALPGQWIPTTGVGAFRPYPECAAVGMPFAGVKMCGQGAMVAAQ